jgi:molybdopterin synthase catalytic subunit
MVLTTREAIDTREAYDLIGKRAAGSVVLHYAVVKESHDPERPTIGIDYRQKGEVEAELAAIAEELRQCCVLEDVLLIRRLGRVGIGEIISLVAASSPNSEDAFVACRYGINRLKKMQTIDKQEHFA